MSRRKVLQRGDRQRNRLLILAMLVVTALIIVALWLAQSNDEFKKAQSDLSLREGYVQRLAGKIEIPAYVYIEYNPVQRYSSREAIRPFQMRTLPKSHDFSLFDTSEGEETVVTVYPAAFEEVEGGDEFLLALKHEFQHARQNYEKHIRGFAATLFFTEGGQENTDLWYVAGELDAVRIDIQTFPEEMIRRDGSRLRYQLLFQTLSDEMVTDGMASTTIAGLIQEFSRP